MQPRSRKTRMAKTAQSSANAGRHKVLHNYNDHSHVICPSDIQFDTQDVGNDKRKGPRGGVTVPFPTKLHVMLSKVEESGLSHIVSWQPHGRCFVVHKPKEFVAEVMPTYFRQSKLTSFQRQLNLYGFNRITTGKDRGGYYHQLFLRHKLFLCQKMTRMRIKGTGIKGKASPETEPDFYSMPLVKPEDSSRSFTLNLEGQVAAAIEEENKRSEPTKQQPSRKRREDEGTKRSSRASRKRTKVAEPVASDGGYESPRFTSMDLAVPALVTPESGTRPKLHVPSSFDTSLLPTKFHRRSSGPNSSKHGDRQKLIDLAPPLVAMEHMDMKAEELHSGDDVIFEGKHFHYLDSFVAPPVSSHCYSLQPRRNDGALPHCIQYNSVSPPFPHLTSDLSESSLSLAQSLREPILTPSSSSSSLVEMFQQDESLEMNPDTIFAETDFGDDDWAVGGAVDIDAEFGMLVR